MNYSSAGTRIPIGPEFECRTSPSIFLGRSGVGPLRIGAAMWEERPNRDSSPALPTTTDFGLPHLVSSVDVCGSPLLWLSSWLSFGRKLAGRGGRRNPPASPQSAPP